MAEYPFYDPVCSLMERSFRSWREIDQKDFLRSEKPMPNLDVNKTIRWKEKSCTRKFRMSWYHQFNWLTGSYYMKKLFCLPCLVVSTKAGVWNTSGFSDIGNVSRSLHKHDACAEHLHCALRFKQMKVKVCAVQNAIEENSRLWIQKFNEKVLLNKRFMQLPIRATVYLGKQELTYCNGHRGNESFNKRGNFEELLKTLVSASPVDIQEHYKTIASVFTTHSKLIQNEIIYCISEYMGEHIEKEMKGCDFFAIQTDDFTDGREKSQCGAIIRYVVAGGKIKERFLGFYDISTEKGVLELHARCLERFDYKSKLVSHCFDGAIVMGGLLDDLQKEIIKKGAPQAVFVHSLAHHLNLVLEQSCYGIPKCRTFFATLSGFPSVFHHPGKRTYVADTVREVNIPTADIATWTSNAKILNLINNEWESLKDLFTQIINDPTSDRTSIRHSVGFLKEFNDFQFALLVIMFSDIFTLTDVLQDVLEKESLDTDNCFSHITNTLNLLDNKKNETTFMELFDLALSRAVQLTNQHEERNGVTLTQDQVFDKYKILYYEILNTISMQITTRFEHMSQIQFVTLMDTRKFYNFFKNFPTDAYNNLKDSYPNQFNEVKLQRLKSELQLIYADKQFRNMEPQDFLKALSADSDVFKESCRLFSMIMTIPSTNITMKEKVPCLKRVTSYLRNTTTEDPFTDVAKISIERELVEELLETQPFYDDIVIKFSRLKDRKINLTFKH